MPEAMRHLQTVSKYCIGCWSGKFLHDSGVKGGGGGDNNQWLQHFYLQCPPGIQIIVSAVLKAVCIGLQHACTTFKCFIQSISVQTGFWRHVWSSRLVPSCCAAWNPAVIHQSMFCNNTLNPWFLHIGWSASRWVKNAINKTKWLVWLQYKYCNKTLLKQTRHSKTLKYFKYCIYETRSCGALLCEEKFYTVWFQMSWAGFTTTTIWASLSRNSQQYYTLNIE